MCSHAECHRDWPEATHISPKTPCWLYHSHPHQLIDSTCMKRQETSQLFVMIHKRVFFHSLWCIACLRWFDSFQVVELDCISKVCDSCWVSLILPMHVQFFAASKNFFAWTVKQIRKKQKFIKRCSMMTISLVYSFVCILFLFNLPEKIQGGLQMFFFIFFYRVRSWAFFPQLANSGWFCQPCFKSARQEPMQSDLLLPNNAHSLLGGISYRCPVALPPDTCTKYRRSGGPVLLRVHRFMTRAGYNRLLTRQ